MTTNNLGANYKDVYAPPNALSGMNTQIGKYFTPGSRFYEEGVGEFVAVKNSTGATISQYSWVRIPNSYESSALTTAGAGAIPQGIGVVQAEGGIPDTYVGWVFVGKGGGAGVGIRANVLVNCAANVALFTTVTAGSADDASGSGQVRITHASCVTAVVAAGSTEIYAADVMTVN